MSAGLRADSAAVFSGIHGYRDSDGNAVQGGHEGESLAAGGRSQEADFSGGDGRDLQSSNHQSQGVRGNLSSHHSQAERLLIFTQLLMT